MKKVLVVVDYQHDFVDGSLGFEDAKKLDEGISKLVTKFAEDEDGEVFFTLDTHGPDYLETQEGKKLPVLHTQRGTWGWELYGKTGEAAAKYSKHCTMVEKNTFGSYELANMLHRLNTIGRVASITFVGVVTNMCVTSNAVIGKAACPEAEIILKKDLIGSFDPVLHLKALDVLASMQMTVE